MITGKKDLNFGLIGGHLSHSFSPQIHACLADYSYPLFELSEDELAKFVQRDNLDGFNVTIPHKKAIMPYLDSISDEARKIGSVNTVVKCDDGKLIGHNTDYYGFSFLLNKGKIEVNNKKVLILGTGGASLTALAVCSDMGASEIVFVSRNGSVNYQNVYEKCADTQIIINCTPVGMYPNNLISPIILPKFKKCCGVVDMIYNPAKTKLLLDAMSLGINCIGGLDMLTAQAKRACELFLNVGINDSEIDKITRKISSSQSNIVLVGMPGCGKTTIAEQLSRLTGKGVLDTDQMIVDAQGRSIPSIFAEDGEDFFRACESEAIALAGKQVGKIISTGGGAVTRSVNYAPLAQNGTIVFIRRPIAQLETQGRPLSQSTDLEIMYQRRLPLYRLFCDVEVTNDTTPYECAEKIIKILERN